MPAPHRRRDGDAVLGGGNHVGSIFGFEGVAVNKVKIGLGRDFMEQVVLNLRAVDRIPTDVRQLLQGVQLLVKWLPTNDRPWRDGWVDGAALALEGSASDALAEYVALLKASLPPNAPLPKTWRVGGKTAAAAAATAPATPLFGSGAPGGGAREARADDIAD